jgi:hypothetical protein
MMHLFIYYFLSSSETRVALKNLLYVLPPTPINNKHAKWYLRYSKVS